MHVSKTHNIKITEYYKEYYPKKSKLYKKTIPFKNSDEEYLTRDFINREEMIEWCRITENKEVSDYIKNITKERKLNKKLKYSLSEVELELCDFPDINSYKNTIWKLFISLCEEIGMKNLLNKKNPRKSF